MFFVAYRTTLVRSHVPDLKGKIMKKFLACCLFLSLVLAFIVIVVFAGKEEEAQRAQRLQSVANLVVRSIQYIKDPATGLCFAYRREGRSLATVPCEAIPSQSLTTAK